MNNELNNIVNEVGIIDEPINNVLLHLNNIQPMSKAETFTQTVKERAEAFKNEYKDTYTPQGLNLVNISYSTSFKLSLYINTLSARFNFTFTPPIKKRA